MPFDEDDVWRFNRLIEYSIRQETGKQLKTMNELLDIFN